MKDTLSFAVRCATADDVQAIFDLERACFPADAWAEAAVASHLQSANCGALLAFCENKLCGYLLWQAIPPEFELLRVGVLPAFRANGIGQALLQALFAAMKQKNATKGFLEVRATNAGARKLYEKNGYTLCGERKNYYKNPTEHAALYEISLKDDKENV